MKSIIKNFLRRIVPRDTGEVKVSIPEWFEVTGGLLKGHHMLLNLNAPAFWNKEMIEGCYDAFIYDTLRDLVPIKNSIVWDIGAHVGYHSLTFATIVGPDGHVVAYEPNPHNVERLRQNIEANTDLKERITLVPYALSNMDGEDDFVFSSEIDNGRSSGSHLNQAFVPEEKEAYKSFRRTKVIVAKADTMIQDKRIPVPSIIKIDVEGSESLVIEGAQHLLKRVGPVLLIEVHHITAMHDTLNLLLRLGYHTMIVHKAPNSSSRCFIVAQPEHSHA